MAELIVENGPRAGQTIPLTRDEPCTIGSSSEATLRLSGPEVAAQHCVVKAMKDDGFGLKALAGETIVNGAATSAMRLTHGDQIQVAGTRIRYAQTSASPTSAPGTSPAASPATSPASSPATSPAGTRPRTGTHTGPHAGATGASAAGAAAASAPGITRGSSGSSIGSSPAPGDAAGARPGSGSGGDSGSGGAARDQDAAGSGQMLGGFRLIEVLGKGGMGTVYRAEQVSLHRELAVKVLNKELTKDPVFVARFVAEARAAARLSHPNVVQVFDVHHDGDTYFYSMEIMHAGSLERRLKKDGKIPVEEALRMIRDACKGLAFAESMRIVHRDIKPDNLMIDHHDTVKIVDLGLAMTDEDNQSKLLGTPHFMSPEQIQKKPLDHRSDLYSLGCTFYRLVTGKNPFAGPTVKDILRAQLKDTAEPANKAEPSVPTEVADIIDKMLQKDPAARQQSANELLEEIEAVLVPPARKGLLIGGIVVAVLVAGGALAYALTHKGETTVIKEYQKDPKAAEASEKARQLEADRARLLVETKNLTGLAKATALEAMAKEHPDTDAATLAQKDARQLRSEVAAAEQARATHQEHVRTAIGALQTAVGAALTAGNLSLANQQLDVAQQGAAPALAEDPQVKAAVAEQRQAVLASAAAKIETLRAAVTAQQQQGNVEGMRAAIAELRKVLDPQRGWPQAVLPEPAPFLAFAELAEKAATDLETQAVAEAEKASWRRFHDGVSRAGGVLAHLQKLDVARAAARMAELKQEVAKQPPAQRSAQLAEAVQAAERFFTQWQAAVTAGTLAIPMPDSETPGVAVGFTHEGDKAGLLVNAGTKQKPKQVLIPLAQLRDTRLAEVFALASNGAEPAERLAFLALKAIADHLAEAHAYLQRLDAKQDDSGTGAQGYGLTTTLLIELERELGEAKHLPWVESLRQEVRAVQMLAQGLRALSERRNVSAQGHLDRLLKEHSRSLIAQGLQ